MDYALKLKAKWLVSAHTKGPKLGRGGRKVAFTIQLTVSIMMDWPCGPERSVDQM